MLRCVISAIVLFCVAGGSASAQNERNLVWIRAAVGNKVTSEGTGFLVSKDGYVLTARTVVRGAYTDAGTKVEDAELSVAIVNRDSFPKRASVSYCEPYICILKINADEVAAHLSAIDLPSLACPPLRGGRILAVGYGTKTLLKVHGEIVGGNSDLLYPIALPTAPQMSGGPVYNDGGYTIGVLGDAVSGEPFVHLAAISRVRTQLFDRGVSCTASPRDRLHERLIAYISGDPRVQASRNGLRKIFYDKLARWSNVKLHETRFEKDDPFLEALSGMLFAEGEPAQEQFSERFKAKDALDWLQRRNTTNLSIILVRLLPDALEAGGDRPLLGTEYRLATEYRAVRVVYHEGEIEASFEHLTGPDELSGWTPEIGARAIMTVLAKWDGDKFVKRQFLTLCVTFDDSIRLNSHRKRTTVRGAAQQLRDGLFELWQKDATLGLYHVGHVSSSECEQMLESTGMDDFEDYKRRIQYGRRKQFSEYFIETKIMPPDEEGTDTALPVIYHYTGSDDYRLEGKAIDIPKPESWKGLAQHIGEQIPKRWPQITTSIGPARARRPND